MSKSTLSRLSGKVLSVSKTGEKKLGESEILWEKCVFTVILTGFSKSSPVVDMPELRGKKVNLTRWCSFDWHFKLGVNKMLEPDETEAIIKGKPTDTVSW